MYSQVSYPTPTTAVLTITDAGPLNVLSTPVIHALTKQLGELAENQELRCLVLRGSGSRAFIAGADIRSWLRSPPPPAGSSSAPCATCAMPCGISPCR